MDEYITSRLLGNIKIYRSNKMYYNSVDLKRLKKENYNKYLNHWDIIFSLLIFQLYKDNKNTDSYCAMIYMTVTCLMI